MVLSAGIVPLRKTKDGWSLLLLRCFRYWDFPKGVCENDEDPLSSALRELREETGIEKAELPWGEVFYETAPYSKGKVARYYLGVIEASEVKLLPNPVTGIVEHHEYRWVSFDEALTLANSRIQKVIHWAEKNAGRTPAHSRLK